MDKIKDIESQSVSKLRALLVSLIEKEGYKNISKKTNDFIEADISRGFTISRAGFLIINSRLSGNIDNQNEFKQRLDLIVKHEKIHELIIVSNKTISKTFKNTLKKYYSLNLGFLERDHLIKKIDEKFPHFWVQNNMELIEYESYYLENIAKDNELKSLRGLNESVQKLIDIYIKPRIYKIEEDKESKNPRLVRYEDSKILNVDSPSIIVGEAGAGKTTFLKKLGELCVLDNNHKGKLPVFISTIDLIETKYDIEKVIDKSFSRFYEGNWRELTVNYKIVLLVDSIDEFEPEFQKSILKNLEELREQFKLNYFLATRSLESNIFGLNCKELQYFQIESFNTKQIKTFITHFFQSTGRGQELIDALSENRILERLPMTPLTISLISILFEEKNLEVPATISDIYDNFNLLLLGKSTVKKRFQFVDINFKERILSLYALEVLQRENKIPMTYNEFLEYFKAYFKDKSQDIPAEKIEDFLKIFISSTGILYLKDQKFVQFKHNSFMEYYAALEIFKHKRDLQKILIDNFFDLNWQNTAIFYAGKSKDMPDFLEAILKKVKNGQNIIEFQSGVMGLGYLLQALYQTDNNLREKGVEIAIDKSIESLDVYKKLASDREIVLFKDLKLPIITMINLFFFIENFKSVTLKQPLKMFFEKVYQRFLKNSDDITLGYKALKTAVVLNSKRIGSGSELEKLIMKSDILNQPLLSVLCQVSIEFFDENNDKDLKKAIIKSLNKHTDIRQVLLQDPMNSLRFTALDQIYSDKKVKIFTEGKTDAEIIEQAFVILTNGQRPYWTIKSAGQTSGGAKELHYLLTNSLPVVEDEIIIGIFDNDKKGIEEFNGLKKDLYVEFENSKRLKKNTKKNVYALKLPIPVSRQNYMQKEPEHNYFSIEHYFPDSILQEHGLLTSTPIPNISKIKSKASLKSKFSSYVRTQHCPSLFKEFIILFKEIDKLTDYEVEYMED